MRLTVWRSAPPGDKELVTNMSRSIITLNFWRVMRSRTRAAGERRPRISSSLDCRVSLCTPCAATVVQTDCGRLTVANQLVQQPLEAFQYLGGGMRAVEIFAAARGGVRPVRFVGEQPLDLARRFLHSLDDPVERLAAQPRTGVDKSHGRHAAGPRLKESVRHSLVNRGIDEDARSVKIRLHAGGPQGTGKLDVGDRRCRVAYPLETGIVAALAACSAYHDEASLRQTPRQF